MSRVRTHTRSRVPSPYGRNEAGFTLLELLVSVTLIGILAAMISGGVGFGLRAWEAGSRNIEVMEEMRGVETLMRGQIQALSPHAMRGEGRRPVFAFWGESDRVKFIGPMPEVLNNGGHYEIGYGLERATHGHDLVMAWQALDPARPPSPDTTGMAREILLSKVAGLRFSYFGRTGPGDTPAWQERWVGQARLPSLIRVEVLPDERQDRRALAFTVAVETEGAVD